MSRKKPSRSAIAALAMLLPLAASAEAVFAPAARGEILAMLNYGSKASQPTRREGIAIIDIDPASPNFNTILKDIPLPPDLIAHHIFYNRDVTKAYVTALGRSELRVFDPNALSDPMTVVEVPDCKVGEDIVFSRDGKTWYLTCMGSSNIVVGDAQTDKVRSVISAPGPASPFIQTPHGLALNDDLDRLIVTSTIRPDLKSPGETVTVFEAGAQKILSTRRDAT
jgi:DNA-binding beta-propeller fold protein YncE